MVKTKPSLYEAPLNRSSSRASMTGNMDQVMELMNMISLDRSMEVGPWEMIGQALYTEFKNNGDIDEGLDEWIKFTLRCERSPFTEEDCERRYHTFQECFRTRKTLAYFARQDSPDQYRRWKDEWIREALMAATDRLSVQLVAQAFFRFAWETFLFDGKSWYHFKQHTWHTMGDSVFQELLADRQKGLYHAFLNLEIELSRKAAELRDNKAERDLLDQQKGIIFKIQGWLDAPKSQKSIMEAAQKMFLVKEFSRIADTNFNLMGCDDCVIDTSGNKAKMRPGMAEDWVTLSCGHSLLARPHLHYGSSLVQEVLYYFQQLFPNKEMNYLAWMICASLIQGGNPHKKIIALVGPTHAGKSGFVDALSRALGPYSGILHSSELDGSRARGGDDATPGKLQRKVTNLMTCGELKGTGKGGVWSWELINRLSGEDMEGGRQLYKGMEGNDSRSIQFRQRNKTFVHTNSVPRVDPNAHESTRERLDTWLVFESKFSYQAPRDTDEQFRQRIFPRDDSFKQKLNDWARALLWIMVQKFEEYKQVRYPVPEISKKKADDYWNECDVYSQFIRSRIEKVDQQQWEEEQKEMGMDEKPDPPLLEMGQLYPLFSSWYKERNPGQRIPNYHDFKEGVLDRIGRFDSDDGWLWWRLKEKRRSAGNGPMRV